MEAISNFVHNYFDINTYILMIIAIIFLIFVDPKDYKKKKLNKERKFSVFFGYLYILVGLCIFVISMI